MRECWAEEVDQRPGVGNVRTAIRQCLRDGFLYTVSPIVFLVLWLSGIKV